MFKEVQQKVNFPELEEEVLAFWKARDIPGQSFSLAGPKGPYVFYEGPPTANGRPGIHHVSARVVKDLFPRFKTMQGYQVLRRGGWDTHGLPVEVEIEKEIGSTGKQDIERFGVEAFNRKCRDSVFRYIQDWNRMTERIGFWVDLDNAYITYSNNFIETEWWILHNLWERGLLYEDYKVTMHCPRCNTSLADHEVSQGIREDVDDPSIWPKFRVKVADLQARGLVPADFFGEVSFLAWTTTPWTLAANVALALSPEAEYALVRSLPYAGYAGEEREYYILAASLLDGTFGAGGCEVLSSFPAKALQGLCYAPLLQGRVPSGEKIETGFRVILDPFVSVDDGTGIVHIAPAYGDLEVGRTHGLPTLFSVDLAGRVYPEVTELGCDAPGPYTGQFFKEADKSILRDLKRRGLIFRAERTRHAYPFCWRDDSPLLFYAKNSWYIRTAAIKDKLLSNNQAINWVPDHIRDGRFGRWLENNVDWAVTRERFWGTPFPVWVSEDGTDRVCVGSVAQLEALAGRPLRELDLHRPYVDEIIFEKGGKLYRRLPYTVDVWFDSGSMPYAQWHYPFENKETFHKQFPADFISEAIDQTRGWFYSLHALAALLTDTGGAGRAPGPLAKVCPDAPAFRNCVVLGFVNDAKGQKMSKSRGNAVDPWKTLQQVGADTLRWYLYTASPPGKNINFDAEQLGNCLRDYFLTLWNVYAFFVLYANLDKPDLTRNVPVAARPEVDRWLISRLQRLIQTTTESLESYDASGAARVLNRFVVDELSNWYVRRNRRRFWKEGSDTDKQSAYLTLYEALVTVVQLMAPMAPFLAESMYQNLVRSLDGKARESVHLTRWPVADVALIDQALLEEMDWVLKCVEMGRSARAQAGMKNRQPLAGMSLRLPHDIDQSRFERYQRLLMEELNVKEVRFLEASTSLVSYALRPNLPLLGKRLGKRLPQFKQVMASLDARQVAERVHRGEAVVLVLDGEEISFEPEAFLVDVKSPEGVSAIEEGSWLLALDTRLNAELLAEGRTRELIRLLQNARKNGDIAVADRIRIGLEMPEALRQELLPFVAEIRREVLVSELLFEPLPHAVYQESVDLEQQSLTIYLG
ncbi:MAG: isoleucine--tRNA ligase [Magnetococcales bacterium]|nr:isoleucine--tRNA ligase [Magnetococcales bacterium]